MISNVSLSYNYPGTNTFSCTNMSVTATVPSVHRFMNRFALSPLYGLNCTSKSVEFTTTLIQGFGNRLTHLVVPTVNGTTNILPSIAMQQNGSWMLMKNNVTLETSMDSTTVQSGDKIHWEFVKNSLNIAN